jgi:hypothetical protein
MDNLRVGTVVYHRAHAMHGPGTVVAITHDDILGVDFHSVLWQNAGVTLEHLRRNLMTLAEKEG